VQIFLAYSFKGDTQQQQFDWERENFGHVLQVMSAFMVAGAVTTHFLVPETRERGNKSRSLEVLACGKRVVEVLNRVREEEERS
jgi:PHS family inorganic phosphate transporter-like MFS transporter